MSLTKYQKQEALVYTVLWAALFVTPLFSVLFQHTADEAFPWQRLLEVWQQIGFLFVIFLLHNFLMAPLLVYRRNRMLYFSSITVLVVCFALLQCMHRPGLDNQPHGDRPGPPPHRTEKVDFANDAEFMDAPEPPEPRGDHRPPMMDEHPDGAPLVFSQHDVIATIMLILMLGMNIGVKLYFRQNEDSEHMERLEKENLQQQLEYLRYQINPHFLMNTLNNIHALVDIDGERAKDTIVELSKIMRFALYEGSRPTVPLDRDVAFTKSYIELMRLRYTDKVSIHFDLPEALPDCDIPPMIFITFVENAFKHGVSYQQESFVDISLHSDGRRLCFTCSNSKQPQRQPAADQPGGVGLQNVRRRLQLIYGDSYSLQIDDAGPSYNVTLQLPLQHA